MPSSGFLRDVGCPTCGARESESCVAVNVGSGPVERGSPIRGYHKARKEAARR